MTNEYPDAPRLRDALRERSVGPLDTDQAWANILDQSQEPEGTSAAKDVLFDGRTDVVTVEPSMPQVDGPAKRFVIAAAAAAVVVAALSAAWLTQRNATSAVDTATSTPDSVAPIPTALTDRPCDVEQRTNYIFETSRGSAIELTVVPGTSADASSRTYVLVTEENPGAFLDEVDLAPQDNERVVAIQFPDGGGDVMAVAEAVRVLQDRGCGFSVVLIATDAAFGRLEAAACQPLKPGTGWLAIVVAWNVPQPPSCAGEHATLLIGDIDSDVLDNWRSAHGCGPTECELPLIVDDTIDEGVWGGGLSADRIRSEVVSGFTDGS